MNTYKLPINSTLVNFAILGHPSYGPVFGGNDIYIRDQSNINYVSYSYINAYIEPTYPSGSDYRTFLTGGYFNWLTTEIEVYQLF